MGEKLWGAYFYFNIVGRDYILLGYPLLKKDLLGKVDTQEHVCLPAIKEEADPLNNVPTKA